MAKSLANAIANIQTKAASLSGMKEAPVSPPDNVSAFPFAVSYPRTGTVDTPSSGWNKGLHTIFTEFHLSRVLLGSAISQTLAFMDSFFPLVGADPTLGGNVDTVVFPIRYTFGKMEWNAIETIGVRFEIVVKIQN